MELQVADTSPWKDDLWGNRFIRKKNERKGPSATHKGIANPHGIFIGPFISRDVETSSQASSEHLKHKQREVLPATSSLAEAEWDAMSLVAPLSNSS